MYYVTLQYCRRSQDEPGLVPLLKKDNRKCNIPRSPQYKARGTKGSKKSVGRALQAFKGGRESVPCGAFTGGHPLRL